MVVNYYYKYMKGIHYISDHEIPLAIGNRCAIFIYKIKYYNSWTTIHGL